MIIFAGLVTAMVSVAGVVAFFVVLQDSREKKRVLVKTKIGRDSHIDRYEVK